MQVAFVLINADLGEERYLVNELKAIEHVKEVHFVYGIYDIIVKVEADTIEEVKDTITSKIRRLERIRSTLTMVVVG